MKQSYDLGKWAGSLERRSGEGKENAFASTGNYIDALTMRRMNAPQLFALAKQGILSTRDDDFGGNTLFALSDHHWKWSCRFMTSTPATWLPAFQSAGSLGNPLTSPKQRSQQMNRTERGLETPALTSSVSALLPHSSFGIPVRSRPPLIYWSRFGLRPLGSNGGDGEEKKN